MVDGIPVFAVRSNQLAEVTAGIVASHRYNAEASADDHLAYTAHTVGVYETLRNIIEASHPEARQRRLTILDVGGGRGELSLLFAGSFNTAMIDVDLFSAQIARELQAGASCFRVLCGDCSYLPIESHSIDVVVAKETAHHMADPEGFWAELARVVRPDGLLVIVEGVQSRLVDRERSLARDRMRQLGATHHHFYLSDMTGPLKGMFAETRIAHVAPTVFGSVFARVGLPGLGKCMDGLLAHFPPILRLWATLIGGGTVVLICRRPSVDRSRSGPSKPNFTPVVEYPVELADVEPISGMVIKRIRRELLGTRSWKGSHGGLSQ
jgi:ubiquinone/menaquinone biosynthesis C-methylase UbiE